MTIKQNSHFLKRMYNLPEWTTPFMRILLPVLDVVFDPKKAKELYITLKL